MTTSCEELRQRLAFAELSVLRDRLVQALPTAGLSGAGMPCEVAFTAALRDFPDFRSLRRAELAAAENRSDHWLVACHEAGHAVAAVLLGIPLHYATVKPDPALRRLGHVKAAVRPTGHKALVFSAAGVIAEWAIADAAKSWHDTGRSDLANIERELDAAGDTAASTPLDSARFHAAAIEAERILATRRSAVVLVALLLDRFDALSGHQITEAVSHAASFRGGSPGSGGDGPGG